MEEHVLQDQLIHMHSDSGFNKNFQFALCCTWWTSYVIRKLTYSIFLVITRASNTVEWQYSKQEVVESNVYVNSREVTVIFLKISS